MDNFDVLWEFAEDSTEAVSLVASNLAAEKARSGWYITFRPAERAAGRYLGTLAVNLREINGFLKQPTRLEDIGEKLEELLAELERVCDWSKDERSHTQSSNGTDNDLARRFPALHRLVDASTAVVTSVRRGLEAHAYASSGKRLDTGEYFSNFANDLKSTREVAEAEALKPVGQPDEHPPYVNHHLYDALSLHASCTCFDTEDGHWVRLRLEGKVLRSDDGDCSVFRAIFSASRPNVVDGGIRWQQLEFHVSSTKSSSKTAKIGNESKQSSQEPIARKEHDKVLEIGQFCDVLSQRLGKKVRVCLRVQGGNLHCPYDVTGTDQSIGPSPSIPLAHLLETHRLSNKMKVVLAYILARSVWQFYSSNWMKTRWLTDSIHFMPENGEDVGTEHEALFACKPCFAFQFDEDDQEFTEYICDRLVLHRYPRILALGILLVEIGQNSRAAQPRGQGQAVNEKINDDWAAGKDALRNRDWPAFDLPSSRTLRGKFRLEVVQPYKNAVAHCFDERIHKTPMSPEDAADELAIIEKRKKLYELVVFPLENVLKKLGWTGALEHIEPIPIHHPVSPSLAVPQGPAAEHPRSSSPVKKYLLTVSACSDNRVDCYSSQNCVKLGPQNKGSFFFDSKSPGKDAAVHADGWFQTFHENVFPLLPTKSKAENRVKIAILDTGIDMSDNFISLPKNRSRIRTQSFLAAETSIEDSHGHGTHTTALLLKVATNADIFVARIAKMDDSDDSIDPKSVENAITEATTWGADIITMSFGFPEWTKDVHGIKAAIKAASGTDILMFCAASNGGVSGDIAFPANQNEVICVNSANGQGTPSGFNPGEAKEGQNLCALGEDVKSSWPKHFKLGNQRKSGTSFATPIAAALAAVVLDYARDRMTDSDKFQVDKLKTKRGMLTVFEKLMSAKTKDYMVLKPGNLFKEATAEHIYGNIYSLLVQV